MFFRSAAVWESGCLPGCHYSTGEAVCHQRAAVTGILLQKGVDENGWIGHIPKKLSYEYRTCLRNMFQTRSGRVAGRMCCAALGGFFHFRRITNSTKFSSIILRFIGDFKVNARRNYEVLHKISL